MARLMAALTTVAICMLLVANGAESMKDSRLSRSASGANVRSVHVDASPGSPRGRVWRALEEGERLLYSYTDFIAEFGRTFEDESEASMRKGVFEANLEAIHAQNARSGRSWTAGVNNMTDWTQNELDTLKGRKWNRESANRGSTESSSLLTASAEKDYPLYVDWRLAGKVSPVKNQLACGSCFIFSAVSTIESHIAIETDTLPMVLSTQEVVDCMPNLDHCGGSGGCNGGTQELVYSYAMLRGLAMNATFPYYGENRSCQISEPMQRGDSYKTTKAVAGITGYMKLKPNDDIELLNTVANRGPVSVSVDASKW